MSLMPNRIRLICTRDSANRARLGLGRTFQAARLFPDLTVRETVQVALEARGRTGLLSTAFSLPSATQAERSKRSDAEDLIGFLGLGRYADAFVADLSTGTRRIVELTGLLALDARILCLDEPTAGIAQRETEALGPVLLNIRDQLGAALVVIEHDMPLITGVSDKLVALELGEVIAIGDPDDVVRDERVVEGYLGQTDAVINRSGERRETAPASTAVIAPVEAEAPATGPEVDIGASEDPTLVEVELVDLEPHTDPDGTTSDNGGAGARRPRRRRQLRSGD